MRTTAIAGTVAVLGILSPAPAMGADLKPTLSIAQTTAPVGVDVPYTITVTPAAKAKGKRVRIQVKGIVAWRGIDSFRLGPSGRIKDDVEGYQPGLGRYRVLVVAQSGKVLAKSPVVSVTWTPREP